MPAQSNSSRREFRSCSGGFDVDIATQMINKDASTFVLVVFTFLAIGVWQAATRVAFKMIDGYSRARKEVISFEQVDGGGNSASDSTGRALAPLFGKLTGHEHGAVSQFGGGRVNTPGPFSVTEQALSHHPLNSRHTHMSESCGGFLFFGSVRSMFDGIVRLIART